MAGLLLFLLNSSDYLFEEGFAIAPQFFVVLKIEHIIIRFKPESIWNHLRFSFLFLPATLRVP